MIENLTTYALGIGIIGLISCVLTYQGIVRQAAGSQVMRDLAEQIQVGAMAFLKREYTVLLPFLLVVAALLGVAVGWNTGIAYVIGGLCSVAAGWAGMTSATKANVRTSEAARALNIEHETGSLQPPNLADILVVDGDPLRDLGALNRPRLVIARGVPQPLTRRGNGGGSGAGRTPRLGRLWG